MQFSERLNEQFYSFHFSMMFGIGNKKARLHVNSFTNLLGEDENGWGLSHKGEFSDRLFLFALCNDDCFQDSFGMVVLRNSFAIDLRRMKRRRSESCSMELLER